MNVHYSDKAKKSEEYPALQRATQLLEQVIGKSADRVNAKWDSVKDAHDRLAYELKISDSTGEAAAQFAPWEFQDAGLLYSRLNRLWGDLLQIRSHKQLEELMKADRAAGD